MKKLFYLLCSLLTVTLVSCDNSKEPSDPANGHEYVDLGLSVKWATCNVGANSPEESGNYFAWGETSPKSEYNNSTYKWRGVEYGTYTKYCTLSSEGTVDNKTILDLSDDAAHVNWGGSWRMPNAAEINELYVNCIWEWDIKNGVEGYTVIGPNGNSIFLPSAGYVYGKDLIFGGNVGLYATSSLSPLDTGSFACLYFESGGPGININSRVVGNCIRPVLP